MNGKKDNCASFLKLYRKEAALVVPVNEYEMLCQCKGNFDGKEATLSMVVQSGNQLFFLGGGWASF